MNHKSVLIIEDDHDIRVTIREVLESEGYHVLSAANGKDGVEILKTSKPNLVLLDLMMPIMDGYEFLQKMKSDPDCEKLPVVVLTAYRSAPKPEGIAGYYAKPFGADEIIEATQQICGAATL